MTAGTGNGSEEDYTQTQSMAEQVRSAVRDHPGLTSKELGAFVNLDSQERISQKLYELKSSGHLAVEKDAGTGRLRYFIAESVGKTIVPAAVPVQSRRSSSRHSLDLHSSLNRASQAIMTAIHQRIEDTDTLNLVEAFGDVREALGRGGILK